MKTQSNTTSAITELTLEELDAVAGGWSFKNVVHSVTKAVSDVTQTVARVALDSVAVPTGAVIGGTIGATFSGSDFINGFIHGSVKGAISGDRGVVRFLHGGRIFNRI
jgi:hypothetical protein